MFELVTMFVFGLAGVVALLRGLFLVSPALAWIAFGGICLLIAGWPVLRPRFLR